ncbi:MAG TPA: PilZ domain-containing protein [Candidatus Sulfotelmatobacter sp.]|nr:PilZ domain-containing protein [Candidatus Sulfotelmatobacter sp.]
MAQDNNDGISYLLALRQSSRSQVSERPTDSEQGQQKIGSQEYAGTNRRREPRYLCVGSAEIREEGCEVRTWATFTDISLHGCYVEAQATYPAGTVLNLKLEANGIRVDTKGNVRVNYPYLGMGIAFVGMTEENVARLRQILANISRGCVVAGSGAASPPPSTAVSGSVPGAADPAAALRELLTFFESRQMLTREEFFRILRGRPPVTGQR